MDCQRNPRRLFLLFMTAVYFCTFISLYVQVRGLYGEDGLYPVAFLMEDRLICKDNDPSCHEMAMNNQCTTNPKWMRENCAKSCHACPGMLQALSQLPTLLWLHSYLGLAVEGMMELSCVIGTIITMVMLLVEACRDSLAFTLLWIIYYSLKTVGQDFMTSQWDVLLVECGFVTILLADWTLFTGPWNIFLCKRLRPVETYHKPIAFWLHRWLAFRIIVSRGIAKLWWTDSPWWKTTALRWYYESQCLPSPLSWYLHRFPVTMHRLGLVFVYFVEIGLPILMFAPFRMLRHSTVAMMILLQCAKMASGNTGVMTWMTIAICLSAIDDDACETVSGAFSSLRACISAKEEEEKKNKYEGADGELKSTVVQEEKPASAIDPSTPMPYKQANRLSSAMLFSTALSQAAVCHPSQSQIMRGIEKFAARPAVKSTSRALSTIITMAAIVGVTFLTIELFGLKFSKTDIIRVEIGFTSAGFVSIVRRFLPWTFVIALLSLVSEVLAAVLRSCTSQHNPLVKSMMLLKCLLFGSIALCVFSLTVGPFLSFDRSLHNQIPGFLANQSQWFTRLQLINSYTSQSPRFGSGKDGRQEVVLMGSDSLGSKSNWKEYQFHYKPGAVMHGLPFVAPHHPRLDWQMCSAASSDYIGNPWFVHLTHKLLHGRGEVLRLLRHNPFPQRPPAFIRGVLYSYAFTGNQTNTMSALFNVRSTGNHSNAAWWTRRYVKEYMPVVSVHDSALRALLKQFALIRDGRVPNNPRGPLHGLVQVMNAVLGNTRGEILLLWLIVATVTLAGIKYGWQTKRDVISVNYGQPLAAKWQPRLSALDDSRLHRALWRCPKISRPTKKDKWLPMDTTGSMDKCLGS